MTATHNTFSQLAGSLRRIGRQELLSRFEAGIAVDYKSDGSVITPADHAVDARVRELLAGHAEGEPVLSEEQDRGEQARVLDRAGAFWLVDPLDGTSNFAGGMPFFAISIARIEADRVTHGATYDPVRDELFTATGDGDLLLNGAPPPAAARKPVSGLGRAIALVDYKRLAPRLATALACDAPYRSQRNLGACALEWAWLACGRADLYLHGGQALWDSAAGSLMLARAGGAQCSMDGGTVFRRSLDKRSAIAARSEALLRQWREWLAPHSPSVADSS